MYSISEVSKITGLTARALRHYEEKGLIQVSRRGSNGYRYFDEASIQRIKEIQNLKTMNFSLEEMKEFLFLKEQNLENSLKFRLSNKLSNLNNQIEELQQSKNEIEAQLMATENFFKGKSLGKGQRRILMETIKSEILSKLKDRREVSQRDLEYLKREDYLVDTEEKRKFISAVKKCLDFAKEEGIKVGPARGAAPALLSLYALGWSDFDPSEKNLIPERFSAADFNLHVDVEFKNGKKFIDFCKAISKDLTVGSIEAFKLPILDIIDNVHKRLGGEINYDAFDDNDPLILNTFRNGDIEKIFSFDFPKETLMAMHFDNKYYKEGLALEMMSEYLKSQDIIDFQDILNIEAIFRPNNLEEMSFMREYVDRYPKAKREGYTYECLTSTLNEYLKPNYGVIIYQEDIVEIIKEYTGWSYEKSNSLRKLIGQEKATEEQLAELEEYTGREVLSLIVRETPVTFCKAHSKGAWPMLIKKTVILKALHKEIYYEEIKKWEDENGYSWGDFGFISGGVSLLQQ